MELIEFLGQNLADFCFSFGLQSSTTLSRFCSFQSVLVYWWGTFLSRLMPVLKSAYMRKVPF